MKKVPNFALAALFVLSSYATMAQAQVRRERSTPDKSANPAPAHSSLFPYHSEEAASTFDLRQSAYCLFLNGNWKFRWYAQPDKIKPELFQAGYPYGNWEDMPVPSHWQLAGLRAARSYDHPAPVPSGRSPGPAGVYQTTFKTPPAWQGRKVFLHLAGVSGSASVRLNGKLLGRHDDDFLPVEFDVTPFLEKEKNSLVIEVVSRASPKASDWHLSGIDRDVFLFTTPYIHARDFEISSFYVNAHPNSEDYPQAAERMRKYSHQTEVYYKNYAAVTLSVLGYREKLIVWRGNEIAIDFAVDSLNFNSGTRNRRDTIPHLKPLEERLWGYYCPECYQLPRPGSSEPVKEWRTWSAEVPYLYKQVYQLTDDKNALTEVFASRLGIRDVRTLKGQLHINGKAVKLKGVHYSAFDPDQGRVVSEELMLRDIVLMKRHNINAVWLSHPHPVRWYELCDAYGLYIIDQYSGAQTPGTDLAGAGEITQGPLVLVQRDYNFASVIAWSWTTGAGWNPHLDQLYTTLDKKERSPLPRPVVYTASTSEEVSTKGNFQIVGASSVGEVLDRLRKDKSRSLLLTHYLPGAGGDSLGSLKNAVHAMNQYPGFGGIFLRQWADQAVRIPGKNGQAEWLPGGGSLNGLIGADGTPKDYLLEVKRLSSRFASPRLIWRRGRSGCTTNIISSTWTSANYTGNWRRMESPSRKAQLATCPFCPAVRKISCFRLRLSGGSRASSTRCAWGYA
jgi:beta-galactosidase